jgi:hypothetical protein
LVLFFLYFFPFSAAILRICTIQNDTPLLLAGVLFLLRNFGFGVILSHIIIMMDGTLIKLERYQWSTLIIIVYKQVIFFPWNKKEDKDI